MEALMLEIHGVPFSVHTRKVLITLRESSYRSSSFR